MCVSAGQSGEGAGQRSLTLMWKGKYNWNGQTLAFIGLSNPLNPAEGPSVVAVRMEETWFPGDRHVAGYMSADKIDRIHVLGGHAEAEVRFASKSS